MDCYNFLSLLPLVKKVKRLSAQLLTTALVQINRVFVAIF